MSNLIKLQGADAHIVSADSWQLVRLPAAQEEVKKQAGKVVLFKLTGVASASAEQIAATELPAGQIVLPLPVFLARREDLAARIAAGEIGVWLESHELVEDLAAAQADLSALPLIVIHIERFADGRAYSSAALLRSRFGFKGELRAIGDVLRDQLFFLKRCGFDAFEIRADRSAADALASLKDFSEPYQGATVIDQPLWRRHARG
ncbi:DUF934 domain-containing protein [Uliginosibacterium sediminicola]|uniref:DUF934 domain-containing protein n=1 Tax=Uliginosibacterium sediminicola TaxID=2024550 RepID=A0ABU9Z1U6_9RHOO